MTRNQLLGTGTKSFTTPGDVGWMDWIEPFTGLLTTTGESSTGNTGAYSPARGWRGPSEYQTFWTYTVPDDHVLTLESIEVFTTAPSPLWEQRGPARYRLGTVKFKVDGSDVGEWFVDGVEGFQNAIMNISPGLGGPYTSIQGRKNFDFGDGLDFTTAQTLSVVFTPETGANGGHAPTVVRAWFFGVNQSTGAAMTARGVLRVPSLASDQVVISYTPPANFRLRSMQVLADTGKTTVATDVHLRLNDEIVADLGHIFSSTGAVGRFRFPFGELPFSGGTKFSLMGRAFLDLGQTISCVIVGELVGPVVYTMRAFHTGLTRHVYWNVPDVPDASGGQSGYNPGDLSDIVVVYRDARIT